MVIESIWMEYECEREIKMLESSSISAWRLVHLRMLYTAVAVIHVTSPALIKNFHKQKLLSSVVVSSNRWNVEE